MEEKILLTIEDKLKKDSVVTYSWLQNKLNISPKECQIHMKKYLSNNKNIFANYLNHSLKDNFKHELVISDYINDNSVIICLRLNQSQEININQFCDVSVDSDVKAPEIVCKEAELISSPIIPTIIKAEVKPVSSKPVINSFFKTTDNSSKKSVENFFDNQKVKKENVANIDKKSDDHSKSKESEIPVTKTSIHNMETDENETWDSDFESINDVNQGSQKSIVKEKPKSPSPEIPVKSSQKKSVKKSTKSKLFENFENVSPKKPKKRHRLVIESDDQDEENTSGDKMNAENDILVEESFEEHRKKKPANNKSRDSKSSLKSRPSKLQKVDEQQFIQTVKENHIENTNQKKVYMKKVEKTYLDEDGFLVVKKVLVPTVDSDEKVAPNVGDSSKPIRSEPTEKINKVPLKSQSNSKCKQTNIMSFFSKNK